ncbi:MAG: hypothetical protein ACOX78_06860 [Lachnospiraceae bacterium]|jgi:putative transport protein
MSIINTILTNQFFLMFLAIATGLLLGKIKIKNFSLGISGGIFTGIVIGYIATALASGVAEGELGYSNAKRILSQGVVSQPFFTFFLFLFLASIGLKVGKNIGVIFKRYGVRFVVIGAMIPLVSMIVACAAHVLVLENDSSLSAYETIGVFSGSMTSTPAYGTALDAADNVDVQALYAAADEEGKAQILHRIDSTDSLSAADITTLTEDQIKAYKESSASSVSLGYTVGFPVGVLVIVLMMQFLPPIFRIDVEDEKRRYKEELETAPQPTKEKKDGPLDFIGFGIVVMIGIAVGNIKIPLGPLGTFSLGAAGGILLTALILSNIGKIGPLNFRMDSRALGILSRMGLTFFMAIVGLRYGYDVINALTGSGLKLAAAAAVIEAVAVLAAFFVGRKIFHLNWTILSGAIAGGCTSAPGLGAAISVVKDDEPSTGYGAAQPFAILSNVILTTIFFAIFF